MEKRTYHQTHPWIKFDLGTERFSHEIWTLLGEAASKAAHIAGVPLLPDVAERFHELFLAKGAQATTAIEGNTLTQEQVEAQVAGKLKLPSSQKYLQVEVQNVIEAFFRIVEDLQNYGARPITTQFLLDLNRDVLSGLELEDGVLSGEIRSYNVTVGKYKGAPPEDCRYLLDKMCYHLNQPIDGVSTEIGAFLKALFAHIYIALIHPFGDGNGRTARLVEYYVILTAKIPSPVGHLLSNHYNKTRSSYYTELDKISKSGGNCVSFVQYALVGLVDGLREQIETIKEMQMEVAWENYVHEAFREQKGGCVKRRRDLVLEIGKAKDPCRISQLAELNPQLAREYALKTEKTLSRDINAILDMELIEKVNSKYVRARKEAIMAFLPWRAPKKSRDRADARR